jgi:hypothetical protein
MENYLMAVSLVAKPLPATSPATAPLPLGGSFSGYFSLSFFLDRTPYFLNFWYR